MPRNNSTAEPTRSAGIFSVDVHEFRDSVAVETIDEGAHSFSQFAVHFFAVKRQHRVEVDDLFVIDRQRAKLI